MKLRPTNGITAVDFVGVKKTDSDIRDVSARSGTISPVPGSLENPGRPRPCIRHRTIPPTQTFPADEVSEYEYLRLVISSLCKIL